MYKGFPNADWLFMPGQRTLDVSAKYASTRALECLLLELVGDYHGRGLNPEFDGIALAVDTFRLGPCETAETVLEHARPKSILVSGYADWPTKEYWFGNRFLVFGRAALAVFDWNLHTAKPSLRKPPQHVDNWTRSEGLRGRLPLILDVHRGGPHPGESTTVSPEGEGPTISFGGGLCPDPDWAARREGAGSCACRRMDQTSSAALSLWCAWRCVASGPDLGP